MRMKIVRAPENRARMLLDDPEDVHAFLEDPAYPEVNIDKNWNSIHFALTGNVWGGEGLRAFLQDGGAPVGDEDIGVGPARVFFSDQVAEIERIVSELSEDTFRSAMQREEAKQLHGSGGRPYEEASFAHKALYLANLKTFLRESRGSAIVLALS